MKVGPSPNIELCQLPAGFLTVDLQKVAAAGKVGRARRQHVCHEVIIGVIVAVFLRRLLRCLWDVSVFSDGQKCWSVHVAHSCIMCQQRGMIWLMVMLMVAS